MNLHDDDVRWHNNVAIVREIWDQNGRWLGTQLVIRRHWRGKDADPQYGWVAEQSSAAFATRDDAAGWVDSAFSALDLARAQKLTADEMLRIASVHRDQQVEQMKLLLSR